MKKEKIYSEGWIANKNGVTFDSNPHTSVMSLEANGLWSKGWIEAEADTMRKDALLSYDLTQVAQTDNTAQQFESMAVKAKLGNDFFENDVWGRPVPVVGCKFRFGDGAHTEATCIAVGESHIFSYSGRGDDYDEFLIKIGTPLFDPVSEEERKREDAIHGIASFAITYQDATEIYDAIAAGKIPHIKLES